MPVNRRSHLRRRPIDGRDRASLDTFLKARFPTWVPSPIKEVLWVKRFGAHLGARCILFDNVPCLLIVPGNASFDGDERWVYRGLPATFDTRPFFFHRTRSAWMRTNGSKDENSERHRWDFV